MVGSLYLGSQKVCPVVVKSMDEPTSKYGLTLNNLLGDVDEDGVLQFAADTSDTIVFTGVKKLTSYLLAYRFYENRNLTHGVSFPDLEETSDNCCDYMFYGCINLPSISFPKLKIIGSGFDSMFRGCLGLTSASFPELTTVGTGNTGNGCAYMFYGCSNLSSLSLPKLKTVNSLNAFNYCFYNTALTTISFPELTTTYTATFNYAFAASNNLTTLSFPKLNDISYAYTFRYCCYNCPVITDIYFNSLTNSSFGTVKTQFNNMFNANSGRDSGSYTIHFPSNLSSSKVSGLTGYPNFGGTTGRLTIAFDLPATS